MWIGVVSSQVMETIMMLLVLGVRDNIMEACARVFRVSFP